MTASERAAALRREMLGLIGREAPIGGGVLVTRGINADFDGGERAWHGDVYVLSGSTTLHARPWPDPHARLRLKRPGPWEPHDPHLDVRRGFLGIARPEPSTSLVDWLTPARTPQPFTPAEDDQTDWTRRAIGRIPEEVRRRLAPFRFRQWQLLRLISLDIRALDLIAANPALAWALASGPDFVRGNATEVCAEAVRQIARRQRDIAGWLGFPANESSVRILRKVPPESCGITPLQELRAMAGMPHCAERLRHLRELPAVVILALRSRILGPSLTPAVLEQIVAEIARLRQPSANADAARGPTIAHLLEDTARMAQMIPGANAPRPVDSITALRRRHDQLVETFLALSRPRPQEPPVRRPRPHRRPAPAPQAADVAPKRQYRGTLFPPPPFPSSDGIEPITCGAELNREGLEMHSCVRSYYGDICYGRYYVYRITHPRRATLGLKRNYDGTWRIDQVAGIRNHKVSADLYSHVVQWFQKWALSGPARSPRQPPAAPARNPQPARPPEDPANPRLPGL